MKTMKIKILKTGVLAAILAIMGITTLRAQAPRRHPFYLHALSDLRVARWMIQHRPGNWAQSDLELRALNEINAAINDIKQAAVDDGKNLNYHPPLDEINDHKGRLHEANNFLQQARQDVNQAEADPYARGLKFRSLNHINAALQDVQGALAL